METQQVNLFGRLNGTPAHVLIIAGLILLLAAPLIPRFKAARVAAAQQQLSQMDSLLELDLEDLRRSQDLEKKEDEAAAQRDGAMTIDYASMTPEQITAQQETQRKNALARQEKETARQKAFDDKREELKKKYDAHERRRHLLNAQMAATGMRWHHVVFFLGNAMLLIGLIVVTLQSTGTTQKIALVILLVAMFSALSGVRLNFLTLGSLGEEVPFEQLIKSSQQSAPNWTP